MQTAQVTDDAFRKITAAKQEMEQRIHQAVAGYVAEFTQKTGLPVDSIQINMIDASRIGDPAKNMLVGPVDVKVCI